MRSVWWWAAGMLALALSGCLESNPQPSPEAAGGKGLPGGGRNEEPADVGWTAQEADATLGPSPETWSGKDGPADPGWMDGGGTPFLGPSLGGLSIASERWVGMQWGPTPASWIFGTFFATPVFPFIGPLHTSNFFMQVAAQEGGCVVLASAQAPCDKPCAFPEVCVSGQCVKWPEPFSVGDIEVKGLSTGQEVLLEKGPYPGVYYNTTPLPFGLFTHQSLVTVSASGGDLPWFIALVPGVEELSTSWDEDFVLRLRDDEDLVVTWVPPATPASIRLVVGGPNLCHGCPPAGQLVCTAADTGTLTVPASLVSQLPGIVPEELCLHYDCGFSYIERRNCSVVATEPAAYEVCVASRVYFKSEHVK